MLRSPQATIDLAIRAHYAQPQVHSFVVCEDQTLVFGSEQPGPYYINDQGVSGAHMQIVFQKSRLYAEDLNSTNSTFLDKVKLLQGSPKELYVGAVLTLARNTTITVLHITVADARPPRTRPTLVLPAVAPTPEMPPFLVSDELTEKIATAVDDRFDATPPRLPQPADPINYSLAQQVISTRVEGAFSVFSGRIRLDNVPKGNISSADGQLSNEFSALVTRYLGLDVVPHQRRDMLLRELALEIARWLEGHGSLAHRPWGALQLAVDGNIFVMLSDNQELHFDTPLEPAEDIPAP